MSETNESPPPNEQPAEPAPRPGMRLAPPGAAPSLQAPVDESAPPAAEPQPTPAAEAVPPQSRPTKPPKVSRRRAAASATGSAPDSPAAPTTAPTSSSTGSSDDPKPPPIDPPAALIEPTQLTADLTDLLLTASETANDRYAPPGTPMFLASESEAVGLARPAARVIARHTPAGLGGPGNPDLADAVSAGITLFRYLARQLRLWYEVKRMHAGGDSAPGNQPTEDAAA